MKPQDLKVPGSQICPVCNAPINMASPLRPGANFATGVIILCSQCTTPLQVRDDVLRKMTPAEVNALKPEAKANLLSAKLALQRILEKQKQPIVLNSRPSVPE